MKVKLVCSVLLVGLLSLPALADITVSFEPMDQVVDTRFVSTASVNIVADIPQADGIAGWGLDVDLSEFGVLGNFLGLGGAILENQSAAVGADFSQFFGPDGDGVGGLVNPGDVPLWGDDILLATITWDLTGLHGTVDLGMSDDNPTDLSEGFKLFPGSGFAAVVYGTGSITVVPSPTAATLGLLGLGTLGVVRRRR